MPIKNKKWKSLIVLSSLLFLFVMLFDILPRSSSLTSMAMELMEEKSRLEKEKESEMRFKELRVENISLKDELRSMAPGYAPGGNMSSVVSLLDSLSHISHSCISSIVPGKSYRKDNLIVQPLEVDLRARYENAYNWASFLETARKVILIKSLTLKPKDTLSNSLTIKTELEVYMNL